MAANLHFDDALEGLKAIESSDLPRYKRAVTLGEQIGWGYYFPSLLARNEARSQSVLIEQRGESCCIYLLREKDEGRRLDLLLAPTPMDPRALGQCLERCNDFNADRSARVLRVDEQDCAAVVAAPGVRVRARKKQYLYDPAAFGTLAGRKFRTVRRNVEPFQARDDVAVVALEPKHRKECRALLRRWKAQQIESHGSAGGAGSSRRAVAMLGLLGSPDLFGQGLMIEGRFCGFALGGEIRPGFGCFFEAKCDNEIQGLTYFQRYRFLTAMPDCRVVNDGSDAGRAGLRQLKQSLRPVAMHEEYRASQT